MTSKGLQNNTEHKMVWVSPGITYTARAVYWGY